MEKVNMTANSILAWVELEQGTATKKDIRKIWHAFPEYDNLIITSNEDPLSDLLGDGSWSLERALIAIGCENV